MISGSSYSKKILKQKSLHDKVQQRSEKECKSIVQSVRSNKGKIKTRLQRQKPIVKQQIRKLTSVKLNEIKDDKTSQNKQKRLKRQQSQNQSSEIFSHNNNRIKISLNKCKQYEQKINKNGFSTFPPPITQILPIVLMISIIVEIIILSNKILVQYQFFIILAVLIILLVPVGYFWYKATHINPTDSIQLQHIEKIKNPSSSQFNPQKHKYFCNLCKTCISNKSFHCNKCNRCVQYFDHHCKWLNNCIGSKNYLQFIQLVIWTQLLLVFFYIINAIIIVKINKEYDQLPNLLWYAVTMMVVGLAPFIAVSMLLSLHLYLIIYKRSTIELILQNRRKNKIYPQNSINSLTQKQQKQSVQLPFYDQSPIGSGTPSLIKQNQMLKEMNIQSNQSLMKFMTNLTNNLKITRRASQQRQLRQLQNKNNTQNRQNNQTGFIQRKINFKPTILKKTTSFDRTNFKSNTIKTNKVQIQQDLNKSIKNDEQIQNLSKLNSSKNQSKHNSSKHNSSKNNQDQIVESQNGSQIFQQTSKNLVSKLRFSTKNQIFDQPFQTKTQRDNQRQTIKSRTQRNHHSNRKQSYPKKLQPLNKNQTQKKIKFITKTKDEVNNNDKQNKPDMIQSVRLKFQGPKKQIKQRSPIKKYSIQNPNTRLFKVVSNENERQQDLRKM